MIRTAFLLLACASASLLFFTGAKPADFDAALEKQAAKTLDWAYERWVGDELVDSGHVLIEKNVVTTFAVESRAGGYFTLLAVSTPLRTDVALPPFEKGDQWYRGGMYGAGFIYVKQLADGEKWVFTIGGKRVEAATPFEPAKVCGYEIYTSHFSKDKPQTYMEIGEGAPCVFSFGNPPVPVYIVLPPGASADEVDPALWKLDWVEIPLPAELGRFFGIRHESGEVWTVTIDGKSFSATAI